MSLIIHPVSELPDYHNFDFARIGSFSVSTKKVKYVLQEDLLEYDGMLDTAPSHFRRVFSKSDIPRKVTFQPQTYAYFAEPSHWPSARYYDIKRAYWQIANAFGKECYIIEGKACHFGDDRFTSPLFSLSRVARGLLVSGTSEKLSYELWDNGKLETVSFANSLYSPHLRGAIQYTLHAIMFLLKRYIVYANTDGIIVPSVYYNRVETFLNNWNINYTIKGEGECIVKTRGTYRIGDMQTATFPIWPAKSCDYIVESKPLWWLRQFQKGKEMTE